MDKINYNLNVQELSKDQQKLTSGGGPIFEGIAWILGYLSVNAKKIAKEGTHPAYSHNGGLR